MSYFKRQGIEELFSGGITYLKELVEDNVFDEYAAQLIAHNMSGAVTLGFHIHCLYL